MEIRPAATPTNKTDGVFTFQTVLSPSMYFLKKNDSPHVWSLHVSASKSFHPRQITWGGCYIWTNQKTVRQCFDTALIYISAQRGPAGHFSLPVRYPHIKCCHNIEYKHFLSPVHRKLIWILLIIFNIFFIWILIFNFEILNGAEGWQLATLFIHIRADYWCCGKSYKFFPLEFTNSIKDVYIENKRE